MQLSDQYADWAKNERNQRGFCSSGSARFHARLMRRYLDIFGAHLNLNRVPVACRLWCVNVTRTFHIDYRSPLASARHDVRRARAETARISLARLWLPA